MPPLTVYCLELDCAADEQLEAHWREWLSPAERERADRFIFAQHRRRYLAAHAQLRWLLGRELGCRPAEVAFELGANGKPRLAGGGPEFNLSHSAGHALVGVHPTAELGADIEALRPGLDGVGIAGRFFTPRECAWLRQLAEPERPRGFCRLWTCKEAWMKADGAGMALPLDRVEVTCGPRETRLRQTDGREWFVRELRLGALGADYCGAVVQSAPPPGVSLRWVSPTEVGG